MGFASRIVAIDTTGTKDTELPCRFHASRLWTLLGNARQCLRELVESGRMRTGRESLEEQLAKILGPERRVRVRSEENIGTDCGRGRGLSGNAGTGEKRASGAIGDKKVNVGADRATERPTDRPNDPVPESSPHTTLLTTGVANGALDSSVCSFIPLFLHPRSIREFSHFQGSI